MSVKRSIRLPDDTDREIQRTADREGKSYSDVVRERVQAPRAPARSDVDVDEALRRNREDASR